MGASARADETDDLVVEERWVSVAEVVKPVERVLERARDGAVVQRAAPDEAVGAVAGFHQLTRSLARLLLVGVVHGHVGRPFVLGALERNGERCAAPRRRGERPSPTIVRPIPSPST